MTTTPAFMPAIVLAWWIIAVQVGITLINAAYQYREKKKAEQEAEEQRRESYSDPQVPHVSEGDPIPVVFGTVRLDGPNVVMATTREDDRVVYENSRQYFQGDSGHQRLLMHLVFCQGPVDEVVEFQSGGRRLAEGQNTSPLQQNRYQTPNESDIVDSWMLRDHYDETGESIYTIDFDDEEFGPAAIIDRGSSIELDRESVATWDEFAWLGGWPDQLVDQTLKNWAARVPAGESASQGFLYPAHRGLFGCRGQIITQPGRQLDYPSVIVRRNRTGSYGRDLVSELDADTGFVGGAGGMNGVAIIEEVLTDTQWGVGTDPEYISTPHFQYASSPPDVDGTDLALSTVWASRQPYGDFIGEVLRHLDGALYIEPRLGQYVVRLVLEDYDLDAMTQSDGAFGDKPIQSILPEHVIDIEESRPTTRELVNEVTVKYETLERPVSDGVGTQTRRQRSFTEHNTAAQQFRGPISQDIEYPMVRDQGLAARLAARDLTELGQPLRTFSIDLPEEFAKDVRPVDVIQLTYPDLGIEQMLLRVTGITDVAEDERVITIEAKEDAFSAGQATTAPPADLDAPELAPPPQPVDDTYVSEAPMWWVSEMRREELGFGLSVGDADELRSQAMMAAITDQGAAINWDLVNQTTASDVSHDSGRRFSQYVGIGFTLDENETQTSGTLDAGDGFDEEGSEDIAFFEIDGRIVAATDWDLSASTATFRVGVHDTTPDSWANGWSVSGSHMVLAYGRYEGDDLRVRRVAGIERGIGYQQGSTRELLALPRTLRSRLSRVAAEPTEDVTIDLRRPRPYPPGNLNYDGSNDTGDGGEVVFSWSHRDRSGRQVWQSDPDHITPRDDVRWIVNIWSLDASMEKEHHLVEGDELLNTESEYTYLNSQEIDDMEDATGTRELADRLLFEVDALDGVTDLRSWQRNRISYRRNT